MTKSKAPIIGDVRFLKYGADAPDESRFKGKISTESLIGFFEYTEQEEKNVDCKDENLHDGGFFGYTSDKNEYTFSSMGWLDKNKHDEFRRELRKAFSKPGDLWWDTVVSVSSFEQLSEFGIVTADDWYDVCLKALPEVFKTMNLEYDNMLWWGNYHIDTTHPHIHLCFLEKVKTRERGKLTPTELRKFKSTFIKEILKRAVFEKELKVSVNEFFKSKDVDFKNLMNVIDSRVLEKEKVSMHELYRILPKQGRLAYNSYNMLPYKKLIDSLIDKVLSDADVQNEFNIYLSKLEQLEDLMNRQANTNISNIKSTELEKLRSQIGNHILKNYKRKITNKSKKKININDGSIEKSMIDTVEQNIIENSNTAAVDDLIENYSDILETADRAVNENEFILEWSQSYKEGAKLFYSSENESELYLAEQMLLSEAGRNNVLALELFGKLYSSNKSDENSNIMYKRSLEGFKCIFDENINNKFIRSYAGYRLGKFYLYGTGTEINYENAMKCFESSNNKYAYYSLGTMHQRGLGVEKNDEMALYYFEKSSEENNAYASYEVARHYEKGIACKVDLEKAETNYKIAYNEFESMVEKHEDDNLLYRLGQMTYLGKGCGQDVNKAVEYLQRAVKYENTNAKLLLAQIYLKEGHIGMYETALKYLHDVNNDTSNYLLGNIYCNGEIVKEDWNKAFQYFNKCKTNEYAYYKMYIISKKNNQMDKALKYLNKSAEAGCEFAKVALAKEYMDGKYLDKDICKAIKLLKQSDNSYAQYLLGKIYLTCDGIRADNSLAKEYLKKSADQGNEYAQYLLKYSNNYQRTYRTRYSLKRLSNLSARYCRINQELAHKEYYKWLKDNGLLNEQEGREFNEKNNR